MLFSVLWVIVGAVVGSAVLVALRSAIASVFPSDYSKERYSHLPDADAGRKVAELLEYANKHSEIRELRIVAGELNPHCWQEIAPILKTFVERKSIKIRLIVFATVKTLPNQKTDHVMCVLAREAPQFVSIRKVSERPGEHFFIVDDRILRVEDPHTPLQLERSGTIWRNSQFKLQDYKRQFDEAWHALEGVSELPTSEPMTKAEDEARHIALTEFKRQRALAAVTPEKVA